MAFPHLVTSCLYLLYFVFFVLVVYALDFTPFVNLGHFRNTVLNPFLSAARLRRILDGRGVDYAHPIEKSELVRLVVDSGGGDDDNDDEDENSESVAIGQSVDQSDRLLLVNVAYGKDEGPLSLNDLKSIARLGLQCGIIDCQLHREYCQSEGWTRSLLALSLTSPSSTIKRRRWKAAQGSNIAKRAVLKWIRQEIGVSKIQESSAKQSGNRMITLILLSEVDAPSPLYYDVLALELSEFALFEYISGVNADAREKLFHQSHLQLQPDCSNNLILILPGRNYSYGCSPGENFNYRSLKFHVQFLCLRLQDAFIIGLFLVNGYILLMCVIDEEGLSWLRLIRSVVLSSMICAFLIAQLPLSSQSGLPTSLLKLYQSAALSYEGAWLRWLLNRIPTSLFFVTFLIYATLIWWTSWRFWNDVSRVSVATAPTDETNDAVDTDSSPQSERALPLPPIRLTVNTLLHQQHFHAYPHANTSSSIIVDERLNALLEDLAQHMLTDVESEEESLPQDYIENLPRWKYRLKRKCELQCVICLSRYKRGTMVSSLPCGHMFHWACVKPWLQTRSVLCPVCRSPANETKALAVAADVRD